MCIHVFIIILRCDDAEALLPHFSIGKLMPTQLKFILLDSFNSILCFCLFVLSFSFLPYRFCFPRIVVTHLVTLKKVIFVMGPTIGPLDYHLVLCIFLFEFPFFSLSFWNFKHLLTPGAVFPTPSHCLLFVLLPLSFCFLTHSPTSLMIICSSFTKHIDSGCLLYIGIKLL